MIRFDFSNKIINNELMNKKNEIIKQFNDSYMTGWTKKIDDSLISDIKNTALEVKSHSNCLVVVGIGGSFLGSYCVNSALSSYFNDSSFKVIYAGTTLSSDYMSELLKYLEGVDFSLNVISKSGTTMETTIAYDLIKELMVKKYSPEELKKRIIITTDPVKGALREEVNTCGYKSFPIPGDIGGRYSIMTAAHLFPLAFNIDLDKFIAGYYEGNNYLDNAYEYAAFRKSMFDNNKLVENFVIYEEKLCPFTEWLKQLFGESEGKDGVGILPTSNLHTRDLHSLGQFIQEGNKIVFETYIKINSSTELKFKDHNIHDINNIVLDSVRVAHASGDVPSVCILLPCINEQYLGQVMYFFMLSAAFSSLLFEVDPFNQPGVEVYKNEVRKNITI